MRKLLLGAVLAAAVFGGTAHAAAEPRAVVATYSDLALAGYEDSLAAAKTLRSAINALIAKPSPDTLKAAREAWLAARVPYQQTEAYRFGNPIVDDWEGRVNAWPLDEGLIDYVDASYGTDNDENAYYAVNVIANSKISVGGKTVDVSKITPQLLSEVLHEADGNEANVATGYHAIEFLLWGQDLNGTGPGAGNRPASDYMTGDGATGGHNERRRTYLRAVTQLLVSDLQEMVDNWKPNVEDNYRATLESEPGTDGLRKMLFGMGSLSLGELAGERMKVSLEANSPEDEQDCFSDNTHYSHFYDAKGIRNVYLGEYTRVDGTKLTGASLSSLVAKADPAADAALKADLAATEAKIQVMVDHANNGEHYDQLIAADNEKGNQIVRDSIAALVKQTGSIEAAAGKLGISDLNPDSADHEF